MKVFFKYIISSSAIKEETIIGRRDKDVNVSALFCVLMSFVCYFYFKK